MNANYAQPSVGRGVHAASTMLDTSHYAYGPPMIDIRIVCTHDAAKLAETLTRLLEAEQHRVRLSYGRQALAGLEEARSSTDAVLLIWSPDARSQTYMLEWARNIDPARLVEIARTPDCPHIARKAPVIDFSNWRGERGGRAWQALNARLAAIHRALNPPKPPPRAAILGFGLATAAAMVGAVMVRMDNVSAPEANSTPAEEFAIIDAGDGVGGPLNAIEPASLDETDFVGGPFVDAAPLEFAPSAPLAPIPDIATLEVRDPTLMERLNALNPLRQTTSSEDPQ